MITAQELIDKLTQLVQEHGNLPVIDDLEMGIDYIEYSDQGDEPAIVLVFDEVQVP